MQYVARVKFDLRRSPTRRGRPPKFQKIIFDKAANAARAIKNKSDFHEENNS